MPTRCLIKQAAYSAKHYEKNKELIKQRARAWTDRTRSYHSKLIARYKLMIGCKVCGFKKCNRALELHHTGKGEEDKYISDMIHRGASAKTLKKEIKNCIILCANCHRELHANR
jgi:hypothetical protein